MRFKSAELRNFKRFTRLTIDGIPKSTRLIVLFGPNGCGKSSFLDALKVWHDPISETEFELEKEYYFKNVHSHPNNTGAEIDIVFYDSISPDEKRHKILRIRPSYRNDPKFEDKKLQDFTHHSWGEKASRMTDNDTSISTNYQKLVGMAFEDLFSNNSEAMTISAFNAFVLGDIRQRFLQLFPDIKLNDLANPLKDSTFRFSKGASQNISFGNLSGGEKAAFDLILDMIVALRDQNNTLFCIDEPDSHMHARLHARLLSVLFETIPESCQLMLATHSLGMMRQAMDIEKKHPGTVALLDFADRNFDEPQVIRPATPNRAFWKKAYDIALDDLATLLAPQRVVICEGHQRTSKRVRNYSHDARCYECIFEDEFPDTRFISMGNDVEVSGDRYGLARSLLSLIDGLDVVQLVDRDDRSDVEIVQLSQKGIRVLSRRNLESYLFADEVLKKLATSVCKDEMSETLLSEKRGIVARMTDIPPDDLKPASGQIYNACKSTLSLTACGNNAEAFMRDTLAPLIDSSMTVYKELRRDIFGLTP